MAKAVPLAIIIQAILISNLDYFDSERNVLLVLTYSLSDVHITLLPFYRMLKSLKWPAELKLAKCIKKMLNLKAHLQRGAR